MIMKTLMDLLGELLPRGSLAQTRARDGGPRAGSHNRVDVHVRLVPRVVRVQEGLDPDGCEFIDQEIVIVPYGRRFVAVVVVESAGG